MDYHLPMHIVERKIFIHLSSILICLILIELFLTSNLYFKVLEKANGASYFYLTVDWQRKFGDLVENINSEDVLAIGSSKTMYALSPSATQSLKLRNFGLVAGSYYEMYKFSELLVAKKIKVKKVFLELNGMSATRRHISAVKNEEGEAIVNSQLAPESFILKRLQKSELFLQRFILKDLLFGFFKDQTSMNQHKKEKRKHHVFEFKEILKKNFNGFVHGFPFSPSSQKRANEECQTMKRWVFSDAGDDGSYGGRIFKNTLENLKKISSNVVLWIPPEPREEKDNMGQADLVTNTLKRIAIENGYKIVDFSSYFSKEIVSFFDCLHIEQKSSKKVTEELFKN